MMLAPLRDNPQRQAVVGSQTFPAPVEGWDTSTALAAMKPTRAVELRNWFPQPGYLEIRKGWQYWAKIGGGSTTPIETLMSWSGPTSSALFAAGSTKIYDATSFSGAMTAVVTGKTNARWQWVNMTTSAGAFLVAVNGADAPLNYNGSAWTTPSITGSGISSSDFIHVNVHKKRLWFVINDSTDAAYLATDAISGTATKFSLGANFNQGGYLVAMETWTLDGGVGPDDYAVFVSSEGQVAIYQGTDPASANTWGLVGVFNLAKPIGRRCIIKYNGSPLIITSAGVIQLSLAVRGVAESALRSTTVTDNIARAVSDAARSYGDNFGWMMCDYPRGTRLIVNIPTTENGSAKQYVMNSLTGAWCEFDGHDANCWIVYNDVLYFGDSSGGVGKADQSGADNQDEIVAVGQTAYSPGGAAGRLKRYTMAQPLILTEGGTRVAVGISVDFNETNTVSTPVGVVPTSALWDTATWDVDAWGGGTTFVSDWTSTPALGRFASVKFTARTAVSTAQWATAEWAVSLWGVYAPELTLQVNGFVVLAEQGGFI